MNDLVTRRQQLITMRTQEKNRLHTERQKTIRTSIEKHMAYLDKQVAAIDAHPDWSAKDKIIQSVPGVGKRLRR